MRIITVPPQGQTAQAQAPSTDRSVIGALRNAAQRTGADFNYLLQTAMRESSLDPKAQAASSSASGLFQFIEQTWLGTVKQHGSEHGLGTYADAISMGNDGRFHVADPALRQEILALRQDPEVAATMAGEMTNDVRQTMESALGRQVSGGELYAAHFLGPKGAIKLIKAAEATPQASASTLFPDAAHANRRIFFTKSGNERSVSSVLTALTCTPDCDTSAILADAQATPSSQALAVADANPQEALRGAISDVADPTARTGGVATTLANAAFILAPVMVQMLAALDPIPLLAGDAADVRVNPQSRSAI
ncbi:MAG: transglycosylase SLT domain-containing protein [Alphaproteobacteria bacterium]|nr:transglycosylase SLT domain-containing protein [Alphaproteobacteria bacterium]